MKYFKIFILCCCFQITTGQSISLQLKKAFTKFESDSQLKSAIVSLYVIDAKTGKVLFDKNSRIGLATASTMKLITAATAYELLGKNFHYTTDIGYTGNIADSALTGSFYIHPSGDPTLGSWRWKGTSDDSVMLRILSAIKALGIKRYNGIIVDGTGWNAETIPGGWTWEDIGNYYGAGAELLNWHENQYDMVLQSGSSSGDPVTIKETKPRLYFYNFTSLATSAARGTGDNTNIFFSPSGGQGTLRGTIPEGESNFIVSGAMPSARTQFLSTLMDSLGNLNIQRLLTPITIDNLKDSSNRVNATIVHTEQSPSLDSMVYWFLKKSINLYGEAFTKTFAARNGKNASTYNGVYIIRDYWKDKKLGIDAAELNIQDGSGLSPQDRVTTHAQVTILKYASKQPWYSGYFYAFPEYNGMKMKSGTINAVKGFCGYHTSKKGKQYIFSFLVNNYNGSSSTLVEKMYKVLDILK